MHTYISTYMYILYTYIHMYIYIFVCRCLCMHMHMHTFVRRGKTWLTTIRTTILAGTWPPADRVPISRCATASKQLWSLTSTIRALGLFGLLLLGGPGELCRPSSSTSLMNQWSHHDSCGSNDDKQSELGARYTQRQSCFGFCYCDASNFSLAKQNLHAPRKPGFQKPAGASKRCNLCGVYC